VNPAKKFLNKIYVPGILLGTLLAIGLAVTAYALRLDVLFEVLAQYHKWLLAGLAVVLLATYIPILKTWKPEKLVSSSDESFRNTLKARVHNTRRVLRRFTRSWQGVFGILLILFFLVVALLPHLFMPAETIEYSWMELRDMDKGPSENHLLGITHRGQDVLTILVRGTRPVIAFAVQAALIAVSVGGVLGALAGYMRGAVDRALVFLSETILAFPTLFIMMTVLAVTGNHEHRLWLIAAYGIASTAKIVRGEALALREMDYAQAAQATGCSDLQVIFQHILVNATPVLIVQATLFAGQAIMFDAYINFLGIAGAVGWAGAISASISEFRMAAIYREPWLVGSAGICLFLLISGFNLVGNALRDAFDVKSA
jgi:peptide/nickel transport system permease protein